MRKHFTAYKQEPDETLQNYFFMNIYAKFGSETQKKWLYREIFYILAWLYVPTLLGISDDFHWNGL